MRFNRIKSFSNSRQRCKYENLWQKVSESGEEKFVLTFDEVENIVGFPIDHSFLKYKKELSEFGYEVVKISMKEKKIEFRKK